MQVAPVRHRGCDISIGADRVKPRFAKNRCTYGKFKLITFFNYKSMLQNAKVDKSSRNRELHIERSPHAHSLACFLRQISL